MSKKFNINEVQNQVIRLDKIFLDLENPRHEPYTNQQEVIDYLCDEEVLPLAKDIAKNWVNPMDIVGVFPKNANSNVKHAVYIVAEGNRRVCAIKLLKDPDLAPAKYKKQFKELADKYSEFISTKTDINCAVFNNRKSAALWLERTHAGLQNGVGRKPWSPEQKTRHTGDKKNELALYLLDYAEKAGLISKEERKNKLTTAQRYLGNKDFREALGVVNSKESIDRLISEPDFNNLLSRFINDLVNNDKDVNSRADKNKIATYADKLLTEKSDYAAPLSKPVSIITKNASEDAQKVSFTRSSNVKPKKLKKNKNLVSNLNKLNNRKLIQIYGSLCSIELEKHSSLLCIGLWAFLEVITSNAGRKDNTPFTSYLSKTKLGSLGMNSEDSKAIGEAIRRISDYGNTTKHHPIATNFAPDQLYNDMQIINELLNSLVNTVLESEPKDHKVKL